MNDNLRESSACNYFFNWSNSCRVARYEKFRVNINLVCSIEEHWIATFVGLVHFLHLHTYTYTHVVLIIFTKNQHVLWYCVTFYFIKYVAVAAVIALRLTKRKRLRHSVRFVNKWLRKKLSNYLLLVTTYVAENAVVISRVLLSLICLVCYIVISKEQIKDIVK